MYTHNYTPSEPYNIFGKLKKSKEMQDLAYLVT